MYGSDSNLYFLDVCAAVSLHGTFSKILSQISGKNLLSGGKQKQDSFS